MDVGTAQLIETTGINQRQMYYWRKTGLIRATEVARGPGHYLFWDETEIRVVKALVRVRKELGTLHHPVLAAVADSIRSSPTRATHNIETAHTTLWVET